jgi:hypothetical protein
VDTIVPYPNSSQSFNRYSYCRNNPLRYIDPTGHWDADGNSSGGFGGHGIGNPGSYGGQQSVGAPGFGDGYSSGYDNPNGRGINKSISESRTRTHDERATYDMRNTETSEAIHAIGGFGSYFRALARAVVQYAELNGALGVDAKNKVELALEIEKELAEFLEKNPDLALEIAKEYAKNNTGRVFGRIAAGALVSAGLTRAAGSYGTAYGTGLNMTAAQADVVHGIKHGIDTVESLVGQIIGGEK